jgi:hypothetical protein
MLALATARWCALRAALSAPLSLVATSAAAQAPSTESEPTAPARAPAQVSAVVPPKLKGEPNVPYPEGATGDAAVILELVVNADGSVRTAKALEPAEPFSGQAELAAFRFEFEPAKRDGRAIAAKIRLEIRFHAPVPETPSERPDEAIVPKSGTEASAVSGSAEAAERAEPDEVVIRGKRPEPSRTATLTRTEVREIPGTFGDPFRAVETMPGVTPIVTGLPFYFVRGAPPGNVGYFIDGIRVPLLFHVGAGPSVIHPGLVDRVDFYPGGYPARFGRFAGGIVAGETLDPDPDLRGEYNLRVFDAGALVEFPFADNRATALVGGRYSYTALLLTYLTPNTLLDYWDYQARVSYDVTPKDRLGVFAFGAYDYIGQRTPTETLTLFGTQFHRADFRYDRSLGRRGSLRTAFTIGLDRSLLQDQERSVRNRLAGARTELEYQLSKQVLFRAGTDLALDHYEVVIGSSDLSPTAARVSEFFPSRTDVAVGARGDLVIDLDSRFTITPGTRVDLYGSEGATALAADPRFAWRAEVTDRIALLGAVGIAHQPPAFVVPLPGFQPGGLRGGLQKAVQESFGVEYELGEGMTATATVFQNAFFDMSDPLGAVEPIVGGCAPGQYPTGSIGGDLGDQPDEPSFCGPRFDPGTLGPDRSGGGGQAADSRGGRRAGAAFEVRTMGSSYGFEFYLKRRLTSRLGGYLSYTLSRSTRSYANRRYIATFDRTHVANGALAYDLGKSWRAGTRLTFYTGLPKATDPSDPDSTRLPAFFRVDLRLEKRWQLGKKTWISFVAEWMNASFSKEAVTTTCTLSGCEAEMMGPVTIPSIGVEGGF